MDVAVREVVGGLSIYNKGSVSTPKRDAVRQTLKKVIKAHREIGDQALNLMDFERTMHLPVNKGRLACDPETGEFDSEAIRPQYNPRLHSDYPRHVHSTITEGESVEVNDADEHRLAIATRKWSDTPLEIKKRFKLSEQDQLQNFNGQLLGERARGLQMERRIEELTEIISQSSAAAPVSQSERDEINTLHSIELGKEREARLALEARMDSILAKLEAKSKLEEDEDDNEDEEESTIKKVVGPRKK